jgi:hypothetical protein
MDNEVNQNKPMVYIIPVVIIVLLAGVIIFINRQSRLQTEKEGVNTQEELKLQPTTESVVKTAEKGTLTLSVKEPKTFFSVGDTVTLVVTANSDGKPITGYDVVIPFDSTIVSYKGSTSLKTEYQIFGNAKNGKAYITGIKQLSVTEPIVFTTIPITEITFSLIKSGTITFTPEFSASSNKTDSNLITDTTAEVLGSTKGVRIVVK